MKIGLITAGCLLIAIGSAGCAAGIQHQAVDSSSPSSSPSSSSSSSPSPTSHALLATGIPGAEADGASSKQPSDPEPLPSSCDKEGAIKDAKVCLPPPAFAKKLCGGLYPEVALSMFAKGTPWTRIWLAGDVEAWNASGGLTHRAKLQFDEEVIVLARHGAASMGGIVMSGAMASYDVLRWDGSCVSVMEGELTLRRPPAPKPAPVPWSRLEETTRRALLVSPKVKASHETLGKACNAAPADKKSCDKADRAFTQAVADFVRTGAPLPTPARRP